MKSGSLFVAVLLALLAASVWSAASSASGQGTNLVVSETAPVKPGDLAYPEASYSELIQMMNGGEIASVDIAKFGGTLNGVRKDGSKFSVSLGQELNIADRLVAAGVIVKFVSLTVPGFNPTPGQIGLWALMDLAPWIVGFIAFTALFFALRLFTRGDRKRTEKLVALQERLVAASEEAAQSAQRDSARLNETLESCNRQMNELLRELVNRKTSE